jgi:hypothetical protein
MEGMGGGGVKPSGLALVAPRLGSIPIQPVSGSYFVMSSHFLHRWASRPGNTVGIATKTLSESMVTNTCTSVDAQPIRY